MNKTFLLSVILGVLCFPVKAQTVACTYTGTIAMAADGNNGICSF